MSVRQFAPNVLEHQARLVLALADRKGWNGAQRLFVALVLVTGTLQRLVIRKKRSFYYAFERDAYASLLDKHRVNSRFPTPRGLGL
jgi:hypothetical protein